MLIGGVPLAALAGQKKLPLVLWDYSQLGSGLLAWWDPTSGIGLGSGSLMLSWTDRKSGIVASISAGPGEPTYTASGRNGTPGVAFSGTPLLAFTSAAITAAGFPTGSNISSIFVSGYATTAGGYAFSYGGTASNASRQILAGTSSPYAVGAYNVGPAATAAEVWGGNDRAILVYNDSAGFVFTIDGLADETFASTGTNTNLSAGGLIGCYINGSSAKFNGELKDILVLNRVLTTSEKQKVMGRDSWKTGKNGSNLPSGHLYKSRPPYVSDP